MSKKLLFSVYDSKAECFGGILTTTTKGEMLRSFMDECNNSQSMLFKHKNDYSLFQIGEFDQESGLITPLIPSVHVADAKDFKREE